MLTLEALRQKIQSQFIEVQAGGETWRIGKLLAADYLSLPTAADDEGVSRVAHYLSKTLCDESGGRPYDSDEGRSLLARLPGPDLLTLGNAAYDYNAPESKKN